MKLHYVGYLVKRIDAARRAFEALGYEAFSLCGAEAVCYDASRQCNICFLKLPERTESYLELIEPVSPDSPVWGLMAKYKNAPYHLCFESTDLSAYIQHLRDSGWAVFQPPAPAPAMDGRSVVFLVHRSAGIVELVSARK